MERFWENFLKTATETHYMDMQTNGWRKLENKPTNVRNTVCELVVTPMVTYGSLVWWEARDW